MIGLQLLNEPNNVGDLKAWYSSTIRRLRPIVGPDFPLYIHDSWSTEDYAGFISTDLDDERYGWVVLDHHLYRCFTDDDKQFSGDQHAHKLITEFGPYFAAQSDKIKKNLVVAEWSACLNLDKVKTSGAGDEDAQRRAFVRAELDLLEKNTGGWWFWTLKKDPGWDPQWRLGDAIQAEIMPFWVGIGSFKGSPDQSVKDGQLQSAHSEFLRQVLQAMRENMP